ncbi:GtrA family protein [Cellvibrio sp. ARAG 10.3]|uniref:GtrA family protein n=1 Tax=Cellvibrio sp. ARAG 10.3 TaxID=3451358 RepID=UPI003F45AE6A
MIRFFAKRQFVVFIVTGGVAALVNFLSRILFNQWLSFSSSVILAYLCGMVTAYVLAKIFVFTESEQKLGQSILYFCLVNAVAVLQTWLLSMLFAYYILPFLGVTRFVHEIAHIVGIIFPVFTSYYGHKRFSFKESKQ